MFEITRWHDGGLRISWLRLHLPWIHTRLHAACEVLGLALGIVAWVYASQQWSSQFLGFFAFAQIAYLVGHGAPEVITRPKRLHRALYFALLPALCVLVLYWVYTSWGMVMWLAVLLGFVAGGLAHTLVALVLLPDIVAEEEHDAHLLERRGEPESDNLTPSEIRQRQREGTST
jgi:hypothetical protein